MKMYTCGPTVYSHAHIGNFRAYIFEDLLAAASRNRAAYAVERVMNLTDVDDKTIRGSRSRQSAAARIYRAIQGSVLPRPRHAADQARAILSGRDGRALHRRR